MGGVLVYGPPGSGKTEITLALLRDAGVMVGFKGSAAKLNSMYQGETEARLAAILDRAQALPGAVVHCCDAAPRTCQCMCAGCLVPHGD